MIRHNLNPRRPATADAAYLTARRVMVESDVPHETIDALRREVERDHPAATLAEREVELVRRAGLAEALDAAVEQGLRFMGGGGDDE